MVQASSEDTTTLRQWGVYSKCVLKLPRLISVAAGTYIFAERTISLACHVKAWIRAGINDEIFDNLGILTC